MTLESQISELNKRVDFLSAEGAIGHGEMKEDAISLVDLLIILAGRKRFIFWVTAAFAIIAIILSLILPVRYTATVTLLPPQQNSSAGAALAAQLGNVGGLSSLAGSSFGLKNPNDMVLGIMRSRTVEDAMVQHFGLMNEYHKRILSDARKEFEGHTTLDDAGKDNLIRLSVEDANPKRAAELANGYVEQFRTISQNLAITEASQRRLFFEQELAQTKDKLASAEEALKLTEQKTGLIQLDSQARALIESAASVRASIGAKEMEIQGMQTYATGENAQLVQAQRELDSLRSQLAKLGGSEDRSGGELIVPKGLVPEASLEYARKLRDVKYYETIFDILARQYELAKLDEAKQGALIQVVDAAIPPDRRSFPKRSLIVIAATLVGMLLAILFVLTRFFVERLGEDPVTGEKFRMLRQAVGFRFRRAS